MKEKWFEASGPYECPLIEIVEAGISGLVCDSYTASGGIEGMGEEDLGVL